MADDIKRMDIAEFRSQGYLQEMNRQFLHPLGLALEVKVDEETGNEKLGGIWDYRDDPEGMCYGGHDLTPYAQSIREIVRQRYGARIDALGYWIQPAGDGDVEPDPNQPGVG